MEKPSRFSSGRSYLFFGLLLMVLFLGCSPISKELRDQADRKLTFQQVSQNPEAYKGKTVIWGGDIIETVIQKDGTTLIVVLQRPLDRKKEPKMGRFEGRFIILAEGILEPYVFRRGRRITAAGEILGKKAMRLGEFDYPYALLRSKQLHLWEEYDPLPE